ncbi:MAG: DUF6250 domain-containing protein [Bacteroides sp.]|nr:DUF6250 domain-containing protein [Roseburia sp.]MCM1346601.1 DUF6250 domain-containing protein [Bacteroides sp.]MCM1420501.1 DUF6250 domain-containing protein [Bacteroides sp.]
MEAEAADSRVIWRGDTAEILAPKGLTLWYKEKMTGNVVIEYDACIINRQYASDANMAQTVSENIGNVESCDYERTSDLNCFWMATDPGASDIWKRMKKRNGIFLNCYELQLYYVGFGGNYNSTTRFRRYDGDERGVTDAAFRPGIIREYTDDKHLLRPNHWYHIRLESIDGRVRYFIDGECLVDYPDLSPLKSGWFGFRTTLAHAKICNFKYSATEKDGQPIILKWIGGKPFSDGNTADTHIPTTFGVPFRKGERKENAPLGLCTQDGTVISSDHWTLAYWNDGSVKWEAVAANVPANADSCLLYTDKNMRPAMWEKKDRTNGISVDKKGGQIKVSTGTMCLYLTQGSECLIDSMTVRGKTVGHKVWLTCTYDVETSGNDGTTTTNRHEAISRIERLTIERTGNARCMLKAEGIHQGHDGNFLPFVVRLYCYAGSDEVKLVHTFTVDSLMAQQQISSVGLKMNIPFREAEYNRHIAFSAENGGVWSEPVQPLVGRRNINIPAQTLGQTSYMTGSLQNARATIEQLQLAGIALPEYNAFDEKGRFMIDNLAKWDVFRLSQLSPNSFSIRKKAVDTASWIGTTEGTRASGTVFVGDVSGGMLLTLKDFWQSYPSTIEVRGARSRYATACMWLWSPEAEPMNLAHYDTIAHSLEASYEDVQEGMCTPYGISRTSTLYLKALDAYPGKEQFRLLANTQTAVRQLACTPEYLHRCRAFGIWSLLNRTTPMASMVEDRLAYIIDYYKNSVEQHNWYGFWNYGDFMHSYDPVRHEWLYDVGGYAWDNTELGSNGMLWYNFLRTGRADVWTMAEAMTRHTSEVDVYHIGPNAGLGSRHNVSHWGCGAKEARISQAAWNRFYYYLTGDERTGDLMTAVRDADRKLYTLDPMRLAQPRDLYPCTAPARLRIGPDWLAYAGNWMTEWERTGNTEYRDKIIAGMKSIAAMPHGIFSGPKALGFDPATGIITNECDTSIQNTNHLLSIMGGFELMNEMIEMTEIPEWNEVWLNHAAQYKQKALEISRNHFRIPRLAAYASWLLNDKELAHSAWNDLLRVNKKGEPTVFPFGSKKVEMPHTLYPIDEDERMNTNDASTWSLDAIFMQEVCPYPY